MDYQKIYNQIIEFRKTNILNESFMETHHIIPRCLGGTNDSSNLVNLTCREHFIVHQLLAKIYGGKLIYPALMMSNFKQYGSKQYSWLKKLRRKTPISEETRLKMSLATQSRPKKTEEERKQISERKKGNQNFLGKKHSKEQKEKWSEDRKGKLKGPMSEEVKQKISNSKKGISVPHPPLSEEAKQKLRKPKTNTENMKGPKSHEHCKNLSLSKQDKVQIYNEELDILKYIKKGSDLPEGFRFGGRPKKLKSSSKII